VSAGWKCPVCEGGNAPYIRRCPCQPMNAAPAQPICGFRHDVNSQYLARDIARPSEAPSYLVPPLKLRVLCIACGQEWFFDKPEQKDGTL
jgi:hypothetical protein